MLSVMFDDGCLCKMLSASISRTLVYDWLNLGAPGSCSHGTQADIACIFTSHFQPFPTFLKHLSGFHRSFEDCVTSDDEVDGAGATNRRLELDLEELDEFNEDGDATLASLAPTKE
jgi:hypothetical protein